jgi:hypothetical protein
MAITNSNTTNQNQNTFDQFFQQQNQTNGNTPTFEELMGGARQTNQAENDFLKLMGGATDTGQVTENANLVNEQPVVPASETAQFQQINADANAIKSVLNQQADQIALGRNLTPPLSPTFSPADKGSTEDGINNTEKANIIGIYPDNKKLFTTDEGEVIVWQGRVKLSDKALGAMTNRGDSIYYDVQKKLFGEYKTPDKTKFEIAEEFIGGHPSKDNFLRYENDVYVVVKQRLEKNHQAEIDKLINPEPTIVAGPPTAPSEAPERLENALAEQGSIEDKVSLLMELSTEGINPSTIDSSLGSQPSFLSKTLSIIGKKSAVRDNYMNYPNLREAVDRITGNKDKTTKFIDNVLKGTRGFQASGGVYTGKDLGDFFGKFHTSPEQFADQAIERAHNIRNSSDILKGSSLDLIDAALAAETYAPPRKDFYKKLNADDYKDLGALGYSLPDFMNRISGLEIYNEMGKEMFFGVGKHIPESFIPKGVVSPEPSKALTNYLFANPLNITDSLSSIGANTSSSDNKTQIFRKVLTESVFKNEENTNRFFNDVYPKVFGDVLSKAVEAGINRDDARKNLPDQFEGFLMATEKAMKTYNGKISDFKEKAKTAFEVVSFLVTKKFPAVGEAIKKQKEKVPEFAQKPIEEFIKNKLGLEAALGLKPPFESGKYTDLKESMKFHLTNLINLVSETKSGTEFESNIYKGLGQSYENLLALSERLRVTSELIDVKD